MLDIYLYSLMKKDKNLLVRFELIQQLITFISLHNGLYISNTYLLKIIECYLNNKNYSPFTLNKVDSIYLFCEKIIDIYEINQFSKFNFILKEFNIEIEIQNWILASKENIFHLCNYHLKNNKNYHKTIFSNQFFKVIYITQNSRDILTLPYSYSSGIAIRILLKGKIFYNFHNNKILLNQEEVLITSANSILQNCNLYSPTAEIIIIHLNYNFIKKLSINPYNKIIKKFYYSNSFSDFEKILKPNFFINNPLFFYELLLSLLREGELISNDLSLISDTININISNLIFCIKGNIKLPSNEIIKVLEVSFSLSKSKLDNLIYLNFKTTLIKLIIKIKIDLILNNFFLTTKTFDILIKEYNIKNINSFKYSLNTF
ncbi:MAG: hypothetical protein ACRC6K_00285, partial [Fusobacteriaceae bacterium]